MSEKEWPDDVSHRDYVLDRAKRLDAMFDRLAASEKTRMHFYDDPECIAAQYEVTLTDEEIFGIKAMRDVELTNLKERLTMNPVAFFNANCGCALFGPSGLLTAAATKK